MSPQVTEAIDQEVKTLITGAQQVARVLLQINHTLLQSMAKTLLQQESLEGEELQHYLCQVQPYAELQLWLDRGQVAGRSSMSHPINGKVQAPATST